MLEVRAGHLDHLGTGAGEQLDRLGEPGPDAGLVALAAELADHADADAGQVGPGALAGRRHQRLERVGAPGSMPSGSGSEVESIGSWPPMTWCSSAASSTVRVHGPAWSRLDARATSP